MQISADFTFFQVVLKYEGNVSNTLTQKQQQLLNSFFVFVLLISRFKQP